jgi:hypothetical protein
MRLYPSQQYTSSLLLTLYFVCLHVYPHDNVKQILPEKKILDIYFLFIFFGKESLLCLLTLNWVAIKCVPAYMAHVASWRRDVLFVKGTVARDFRPLVFSTNIPHIIPEFTP